MENEKLNRLDVLRVARAIVIILLLFNSLVVFLWGFALLCYGGVVTGYPALSTMEGVLFVFAIGLSMMTATMWVGYNTGILITLSESVVKNIWRTLIATILVAIGAAVARALNS